MSILPLITGLLLLQADPTNPALKATIEQLLHTVIVGEDNAATNSAGEQAKQIFIREGLPSVAAVGDEASYGFVFLTCTAAEPDLRAQVLEKVREAAAAHRIPPDAATYCEAHVRQETTKAAARKFRITEPALHDQIELMIKSDQAVRAKGEDMAKMMQTDRENAAPLEAMFAKYGLPTFRMVGPRAAGDFVLMVQHQSPSLRSRVLPLLKAAVDAGEADPQSYALVYDRSQTDQGKMQRYGENFTCDSNHPLHPAPLEDEAHVDERRAAIGLQRIALYAMLLSSDGCGPAPSAK